jgi:hypothetical protein
MVHTWLAVVTPFPYMIYCKFFFLDIHVLTQLAHHGWDMRFCTIFFVVVGDIAAVVNDVAPKSY